MEMTVPVATTDKDTNHPRKSRHWVVADVGGTHARLAMAGPGAAPLQGIEIYRCADFGQLGDLLAVYLASHLPDTTALAGLGLALPGAVHLDPITLVNIPWTFSLRDLESRFGCQVVAINDFTAQACALPVLTDRELHWLRRGKAAPTAMTVAVVGPGTGLGVAARLADGGIVDSEAGHIGFAPVSTAQQRLLTQLWQWYPRLSVERLLSGPGLANIHRALSSLAGRDSQLRPEQITAGAQAGDRTCLDAVRCFTEIFGAVCGDLALALGATGGLYLSGGVLEKLGPLFDQDIFMTAFDYKGRYTDYCRHIPIARIISAHPGLIGMAQYLADHHPGPDHPRGHG